MITLLITRPNYEKTTYYLFHWNKKILTEAQDKKVNVIDLAEKRANKKELVSALSKRNPGFVILNGHGDANLITGQENETLIKAGENEQLLEGKVVYALSCKTAQTLGPASMKKGCKLYIGYSEDFTFWFKSPRPLEDPWARYFLDTSNSIPIGLLKGHTVKEVYERAKSLNLKNIRKLIATKSPDSFLIPDLLWNMSNLRYLGKADAHL